MASRRKPRRLAYYDSTIVGNQSDTLMSAFHYNLA